MFWTKISKALLDIIVVVAVVVALMLGEGFSKMMDSLPAGILGFVLGIIITAGAGVAIKSLTKTSDALVGLLGKLEGNGNADMVPKTLEDVEEIEKISETNLDGEDNYSYSNPLDKWKDLSVEIRLVWIESLAMLIGTMVLSAKVFQVTEYGAILILGFGVVVNMLINAIVGTAVENHHKLERVNFLMKTRNKR